jgi:hypothetical protein
MKQIRTDEAIRQACSDERWIKEAHPRPAPCSPPSTIRLAGETTCPSRFAAYRR